MENVLVIGSGGREQALAWKIAQSDKVSKVYIAPGNGGSKNNIENVNIAFDDKEALLKFVEDNEINFTVIGQEAASDAGVVDLFLEKGHAIFGPTKAATKIESSKAYAKELMKKHGIKTADFENFDDAEAARMYAKSHELPVVIKADGLATGKGVIIANSIEEIDKAIDEIMVNKVYGDSGNKVVVESFLTGKEASMHALSDGIHTALFPPSQDHKQAYDGDQGPNTGGMGVISPIKWISTLHMETVKKDIVEPILKALREDGAEFKGCLYPGVMIEGDDISVVEFNARFGDPETEVYMRLLDSDIYEILKDCASGNLDPESIKWKSGYAVTVVIALEGYPGKYAKGAEISGIEKAEQLDGIVVFHAGTSVADDKLITSGGRVLNVTATDETLEGALEQAYRAVDLIDFNGKQFRTDIGKRV
jgi:phosphoribosylamine--glycine ligase